MKDIINKVKSSYAAEHGKGSWEEFMDWNTLTHTSLERIEKHMDELILRIEKHYQRSVQQIIEHLREISAQLEMHQGYESKLSLETKDLISKFDDHQSTHGHHYEELIESRKRLQKLKLNIQVDSLKNLVQELKKNWEPKTRLFEGKLIHGSKSGDEIKFTQYFDEFSCQWTTKVDAFRGFILKKITQKEILGKF